MNKDDFNRNADNQVHDWREKSTELEPTLKRELDQREKMRSTPKQEMHYTIGGDVEKVVHEALQRSNEQRIKEIQKQLKADRERPKNRDKYRER